MAKTPFRDPQGRHIRVYVSLLNSPAYRVLGRASKVLFFDLREQYNGMNNGNIEATLTRLKHKGWRSSATLATALFELQALGFIRKTRGGGVEYGSRVCSLYRFTDVQSYAFPALGVAASSPTNDYMAYESVKDAKSALNAGVSELREQAKLRKRKASVRRETLQKVNRTASEIESEDEV